ncbi:MAG: DUF3830 family protein [Gammaproteobacteria bacterium]|nr:DUF3830 family protein [Gammaproteobacteria bacterium]
MKVIQIQSAGFEFKARLEEALAPRTCERFLELLPYTQKVIHSRWSGEAVWIPLGNFDLGVDFENHTSYGSRGDVLFYPGGFSETEFLFVYGSSQFGSKMGRLAGNHFLTLIEGHEHLEAFGKRVLWEGAQSITFSLSDA